MADSLIGGLSIPDSVIEDLGHSDSLTAKEGPAPITINGFTLPAIPEGTPTTMVMVPVPITTAGPAPLQPLLEEAEVLAFMGLAVFIFMLPVMIINQKCCCVCLRRFMSRRTSSYFFLGLILNCLMFGILVTSLHNVSTNGLFFQMVAIVEKVSNHLEQILNQIVPIVAVVVAFTLRKRIISLLGFDTGIVKADLRDIMTCFSMNRFQVIEVALLKCTDLPAGLMRRTLYARIVLGFNEPLHTRPHDNCLSAVNVKERMQLNYDAADETVKMTITIKQQEIVSSAIQQFAPAAGAVMGATMLPLEATAGAAVGAVTGMGAANSLGVEIARVELSSAQIQRLMDTTKKQEHGKTAVGLSRTAVAWNHEDNFVKVDMLPQGYCWLHISEVQGAEP